MTARIAANFSARLVGAKNTIRRFEETPWLALHAKIRRSQTPKPLI